MSLATDSRTFPNSAPHSRLSLLAENPSRPSKLTGSSRQSAGRQMVLNARKIYRPGNKIQHVLLAIEDATERVRLEREHTIAGERIGMLLQELTHRVKNSLQIIAAMVSIEARSHKSGEGKAALERVSHRINALGQLYSKLSEANTVEAVDAATYLDELCRDLIASVHKEGGTSIVLKTDIESESPADRSGNYDRAHGERARDECRQICFSGQYNGDGPGDAKASARGASPDGRRQRPRDRSSTHRFRARRPAGRGLRPTARRPTQA
jgi:hypothetical protein